MEISFLSKDRIVKRPLRIVTRPDLDGLVCALLLRESFGEKLPVLWTEPGEMEKKRVEIEDGDVIANLPYDERALLWFDHHQTNRIEKPFNGRFELAPSAAGIIFDYYKDRIDPIFTDLVKETDRIDSAKLNESEVLHPEKSPYFMLSLTIKSGNRGDSPYWDYVLDRLSYMDIRSLLKDREVSKRVDIEVNESERYKTYLLDHTTVKDGVSVTDFRGIFPSPTGNRFLVFSLLPDSNVNVKIRNGDDKRTVIVSVGHSIFRKECTVHCGKLVSLFGGGGHFGAGSCSFPSDSSEKKVAKIIRILRENREDFSQE